MAAADAAAAAAAVVSLAFSSDRAGTQSRYVRTKWAIFFELTNDYTYVEIILRTRVIKKEHKLLYRTYIRTYNFEKKNLENSFSSIW